MSAEITLTVKRKNITVQIAISHDEFLAISDGLDLLKPDAECVRVVDGAKRCIGIAETIAFGG